MLSFGLQAERADPYGGRRCMEIPRCTLTLPEFRAGPVRPCLRRLCSRPRVPARGSDAMSASRLDLKRLFRFNSLESRIALFFVALLIVVQAAGFFAIRAAIEQVAR